MHIINPQWATFNSFFVQRKVIIARPRPVVRPLDQAFSHRIQVQIIQPFAELLSMADKAVPELMLPNRPRGAPSTVEGARRNPFDILNHAGNGEGKTRPEKRVPVIRHQHVSQKQKAQFQARCFQGIRHLPVFCLRKGSEGSAQIDGNEEDPV